MQKLNVLRFQVFTAAGMKMAVFWDAVQCILLETDDVSEVLMASTIKLIRHILEVVRKSETSVGF
jgi:hypothetical protein